MANHKQKQYNGRTGEAYQERKNQTIKQFTEICKAQGGYVAVENFAIVDLNKYEVVERGAE